jgi:hypothetical protein
MGQPTPGSFWDAIRSWADSAGLLLPPEEPDDQKRPHVPASVCDNCPICQGAATLEQVNPEVIAELADVARNVLSGVGSALAAAAEQRLAQTSTGTRNAPFASEVDEPTVDGPTAEETTADEPTADEPPAEEPEADEPAVEGPTAEPGSAQPGEPGAGPPEVGSGEQPRQRPEDSP